MILLDAPDPTLARSDLNLICEEMGVCNLMALTESSGPPDSQMQGTLSVKSTLDGEEEYYVGASRHRVGAGSYLVLNHGQWYAGGVPGGRAVQSLAIFFRPGFAEQIAHASQTAHEHLLENPSEVGDGAGPFRFVEMVHRRDDDVGAVLAVIGAALRRGRPERGWLEEQFHAVMRAMLRVHRGIAAEMQRLPGLRHATRVETYRRLAIARQYIRDCYSQPIALQDMAREACMAPHHFLRLFAQAFGATPHQFRTHLRLKHAKRLLAETDMSITQICFELGFQSPASFSHLFRRHAGMAPAAFRALGVRGDGNAPS